MAISVEDLQKVRFFCCSFLFYCLFYILYFYSQELAETKALNQAFMKQIQKLDCENVEIVEAYDAVIETLKDDIHKQIQKTVIEETRFLHKELATSEQEKHKLMDLLEIANKHLTVYI